MRSKNQNRYFRLPTSDFRLPSLFALTLAASSLFSTALSAAEAAKEGGAKPTKSLLDLFKQTGAVGWMLAGLSVIGTSLLILYFFNYSRKRLSSTVFLEDAGKLLKDGDLDGAYELALSDDSYAGRVMAGALGRRAGGYGEVKDGLIEASVVENFRINAKISYLSLVGNIGPLLGLLGTVTGMISSFQEIERLTAPTPGDLAKGVYESLVNTTMGLFIAIIFLTAYFFMKNKVSDITLGINNEISNLLSGASVLEPEPGGARADAGV